MNKISVVGIDLGKNVFHVRGVDQAGQRLVQRRFTRTALRRWLIQLPPCVIGMETCAGAHHWGRWLRTLGHDVRLMSPQFVKAYVKSNKNDARDAEAICEAVTRPTMRYVPIKSRAQQELQMQHRIRQRVVAERTALANQIRGFLLEFGIPVSQGIARLRRCLPDVVEDGSNELTPNARAIIEGLRLELRDLDEHVAVLDGRMMVMAEVDDRCRRLQTIPGIGPLTATALVASIGDARQFANARSLSAWLGLVPRQHSTGGKSRLLGISKRGDRYLRTLLIHGARAALRGAAKRQDRRSQWVLDLEQRRGRNIAIVALANKMARMVWAVWVHDEDYQPLSV